MPSRITLAPGQCICGKINCEIPFGLCHCGCGGKTLISRNSDRKLNYVIGMPRRYINHHASQTTETHANPRIDDIGPVNINGNGCFLICLTRGRWAIVDSDDYDKLKEFNWSALWNKDTKSFYAHRKVSVGRRKTKSIQMHRIILGLKPEDKITVDHINHDTIDNRKSNLRTSTITENCWNQGEHSNNTSGYKGVFYNNRENYWQVSIRIGNGKRLHIRNVPSAVEGFDIYCRLSIIHHVNFTHSVVVSNIPKFSLPPYLTELYTEAVIDSHRKNPHDLISGKIVNFVNKIASL